MMWYILARMDLSSPFTTYDLRFTIALLRTLIAECASWCDARDPVAGDADVTREPGIPGPVNNPSVGDDEIVLPRRRRLSGAAADEEDQTKCTKWAHGSKGVEPLATGCRRKPHSASACAPILHRTA